MGIHRAALVREIHAVRPEMGAIGVGLRSRPVEGFDLFVCWGFAIVEIQLLIPNPLSGTTGLSGVEGGR